MIRLANQQKGHSVKKLIHILFSSAVLFLPVNGGSFSLSIERSPYCLLVNAVFGNW
jgi:hypothetical protein